MNFKGRYTIVGIITVACLVFFIPYENQEKTCDKCLDCSSLLKDIKSLPSFQNDLVVVKREDIGNKTFKELKLEKLKQMINEQKAYINIPKRGNAVEKQLGNTNWILDCISWQEDVSQKRRKQDASKISQNRSISYYKFNQNHFNKVQNNTNFTMMSSNKTVNLFMKKKDFSFYTYTVLLSSLHTIITQVKHYLQKDSLSLLDIYCGDMNWLIYFLKSREDVKYTCIDNNQNVINRNKNRYQKYISTAEFYVYDVIANPLKSKYDIVLLSGILELVDNHIQNVILDNIIGSKSNFLVILKNNTVLSANPGRKNVSSLNNFGDLICQSGKNGLMTSLWLLDDMAQ